MNKDRIGELKKIANTQAGHEQIQKLRASKKLSEWELKEIYSIGIDDGIIEKINETSIEK